MMWRPDRLLAYNLRYTKLALEAARLLMCAGAVLGNHASAALAVPCNNPTMSAEQSAVYATALEADLQQGNCHVEVGVLFDDQQVAAQTYANANGQPTAACPAPDVIVKTIPKSLFVNGGNDGAYDVITYSY